MATLNFNINEMPKGGFVINAIIRDKSIKDRIRKSLGFTISSKRFWNSSKQRAKDCKDAAAINHKIIEWETIFNTYTGEIDRQGTSFQPAAILLLLDGESVDIKNPALNLTDLFLDFMGSSEMRMECTPQTIKRYDVMYNQLLEYELYDQEKRNPYLKRGKITLGDVDRDFYYEFAEWLITEQDNANSTINRKFRHIKTVMRYGCKVKRYFKGMDWDVAINLKEIEVSRGPLLLNEIHTIQNASTNDLTERLIIDAFLTSLYTGLRYSDLQQLADIHMFKEGDMNYINLNMEKGMAKTSIAVPDFLATVLKRYSSKGKFFRLGHNALSNKILKKIAKRLELTRKVEIIRIQGKKVEKTIEPLHKAISFHIGRYTYTNLLDTGGLQATYIQRNLGHKDIATTQKYLKSDIIKRMNDTVTSLKKMVNE